MLKTMLVLVALTSLLLVASASAATVRGRGSLRVQVVNAAGHPAGHAYVRGHRLDSNRFWGARTNGRGKLGRRVVAGTFVLHAGHRNMGAGFARVSVAPHQAKMVTIQLHGREHFFRPHHRLGLLR